MKSRSALRVAAAVAVSVVVSLACAQTPMPVPSTPDAIIAEPIDSLDTWDRHLRVLTEMSWTISKSGGATAPDHAGRSLESYWNENVLARESKRRLDELHATAVAQTSNSDSEGLKSTLAEAEPLLRAEVYKSFVVLGYWGLQENVAYRLQLLQPWLERASPEEKKKVSDRADAAFETMIQNYTTALASKDYVFTTSAGNSLLASMNDGVRFLDDERKSLVTQQATLPNPITVAPLKREEPCTLSIAPQPGASRASVAVTEFPSAEQYYPAQMKGLGVTGDVMVKVEVSTKGCADAVSIFGSSGVRELDEAGLKYAMDGHYLPAADGDKPAPGSLVFRIKFELQDGPKPPLP